MANSVDTRDIFVEQQLTNLFNKIHIADNSVDKNAIHQLIFEYFKNKFADDSIFKFEYDFIDLFCGAGGLSVGLEQKGFRPVLAVDKEYAATLTYRFNRPWLSDENIIHEDIRSLVERDVFPHVPLVVGGPPCQGFSIANMHKKENDERNILYRFYVHSVLQSQPDIFLMENVEGILSVYESISHDFEEIGYHTCPPLLLNARDFGFPQNRKRAFILGIKKNYATIVDELYSIFRGYIDAQRTSVGYCLWDAIIDLPELKAKTLRNSTYIESREWGYTFWGLHKIETPYAQLVNQGLPSMLPLLNHRSKYNNDRDIQIYQLLKQGDKSDAECIQEINPYKNRAGIFRDKFDKLRANEPCKAITAHMYYDCNMYIHPYQARGLTPREAARIQGFPDDYLFLGAPNEWYRQIGNAVSPLMARTLGGGLKKVLERIYRV